jgi:hypothetical protein
MKTSVATPPAEECLFLPGRVIALILFAGVLGCEVKPTPNAAPSPSSRPRAASDGPPPPLTFHSSSELSPTWPLRKMLAYTSLSAYGGEVYPLARKTEHQTLYCDVIACLVVCRLGRETERGEGWMLAVGRKISINEIREPAYTSEQQFYKSRPTNADVLAFVKENWVTKDGPIPTTRRGRICKDTWREGIGEEPPNESAWTGPACPFDLP